MTTTEIAYCPICDMRYCPAEPGDPQEHTKRHRLVLAARKRHPGILRTDDQEAAAKAKAYPVIHDRKLPVAERVAAAEKLAFAKFSGSVLAPCNLGIKPHPKFPEFMAALTADPASAETLGADVLDMLRRKFPPKANPHYHDFFWYAEPVRRNRR